MIKNDFKRLRCPRCKRFYLNKDKVFLDEINTVIHQECYSIFYSLPIVDGGTYRDLIKKYEIFDEYAFHLK